MKVIKFEVPIYDWEVKILIASKKDADQINRILKKFKIPKKNRENTIFELKKGYWGGDHIYNRLSQRSIILVSNCKSIQGLSKILFHELRHLEDRILETMSVENNTEAAAFLSGYIYRKIIPKLFKLK